VSGIEFLAKILFIIGFAIVLGVIWRLGFEFVSFLLGIQDENN